MARFDDDDQVIFDDDPSKDRQRVSRQMRNYVGQLSDEDLEALDDEEFESFERFRVKRNRPKAASRR